MLTDAAMSPVTFLLNKMEELVSREYELLAGIKNAVEELRREFQTIEAFLIEAEGAGGETDNIDGPYRVWVGQVRELAYDIEDGIDQYTFHTAARHRLPEFLHLRKRRSIAVLVQDINAKLERVRQTRDRYSQVRPSPATPHPISFTTHFDRVAPLFKTEPVGIEEVLTELTTWAKFEEPRLKVRFVVGMGGLGKTLVAKQVYEATKLSFDCWGWIECSRSQSNELLLRTLLTELLKSMNKPTVPHEMTVVQLMNQLICILKHRKYMIVFDDLWSKGLWELIKCALPTENHSRIMITTRRGDIAHFCCNDQSTATHILQPLTWSESEKLFFKNAFPSSPGNHWPPGLLEWARKLLTQCEGWPLGVVTIGKYASTMDQTVHAWRQLYESLGWEMEKGGRLSSMTTVLSASYSDLPYNMKYCLLYFSAFPEDYSVRRRRLIRMWVSEGLVKEETGKTLEDVGGNYLEQLIRRNLVLVNEFDFDGRPKTCRVHRILHKIILSISRQENFSRLSTETDLNDRVRRLSFTGTTRSLAGRGFPSARLFLVFGSSQDYLSILSSFKVLKVLDLEGASQLDTFPAAILNLILLRYLSLRNTRVNELPWSIWKLQNLETIDLKHTFVTSVPRTFFTLGKLRNLLIYRYNAMVYVSIDSVQGFKASKKIGNLVSLQKLTCLKANRDAMMLKALQNLTSLKKLGVVELREGDGRHLCCSIEKMQKLKTLDVAARKDEVLDMNALCKPPPMLQRLYLKGKLRKLPGWVSSLHDLVRIGLRWSKLEESPIDALEDLPNLMEIQLVDAYKGKQLVFHAGKFQSLKVLEVEDFEFLQQMVIKVGSLQRLQNLTMRRCRMVEQFPGGICGLTQMKELRLYDMPESMVNQIEAGRTSSRPFLRHIPFICAYTLDSTGHWQPRVLS